jgi:hypothetical protein
VHSLKFSEESAFLAASGRFLTNIAHGHCGTDPQSTAEPLGTAV